jgi:hypothetical protein
MEGEPEGSQPHMSGAATQKCHTPVEAQDIDQSTWRRTWVICSPFGQTSDNCGDYATLQVWLAAVRKAADKVIGMIKSTL